MMFAQGSFVNDANATPEQIARKRAYIAAMMPKFGSAKYVGEGIGQLATGVMIGRQNKKLDGAESEGRKSADERFKALLGTGSTEPGAFTVLGSTPMDGPPMPPPDPNSPHALGNDAMAALGKPAMSTGSDAASIKAGLVARGLPEHVAEGFVMNFEDESGLNPGINEISPLVPGSRGGFGLYQLTGPRRRAYEAYATERGVPFDDVDAQLDFMMGELQGSEAKAAGAILSTKTPGEAGAAIVNEFLRPSPEHRSSRASRYLAGAPQGQPAPAGYNAATPSIPTDQLLAALSDPWLAPEQRAMLTSIYEQQVQAGDPMRQLELQKAQMEVEQMQNPTPDAGFTQLSADEAAGLGLPPGVYQRGPDGRIDTIEKTQGTADDTRYQPVGGQIWDMRPEGGGPPQLVGGGTEEVIYGADGQPIVTRGPAGSSKPFTEGQSKDVVYATRAQGALDALEPIAGTLTDRGDVAAGWLPMGLGGDMQSPDYQVAKTAGDEFLQAILRKDTGAAITADEQTLYGETYLPKPGDSPERLAYKSEARKRAVAAIEAGMSPAQIIAQERALQKGGKAATAPAEAPAAIPEGVDPADWEFMTPEERALFQ